MNDITNRCPNHESLVTYLYDESEPAERTSIAAHVAVCASCAEEVQGLSDTRAHLASWSPPALPLGFQITRIERGQGASVLRPDAFGSPRSTRAGWWRQPLPAWAQAAAAVAIFAAGMSAGTLWPSDAGDGQIASADQPAAVSQPVITPVSHDDIESLNARLLALERQTRSDSVRVVRDVGTGIDERALMARVGAFVDARITQGERQNMRLIAQEIGRLDNRADQLSSRADALEGDTEDFRRVLVRGYAPSSLVQRTSLQTGAR